MKLEFLMEFESHIKDIQIVGDTPKGKRIIYVVGDGTFKGPKLEGITLEGGAGDWMMILKEGLSTIDVRKTFKTDDGALIFVTYQGLYQFDDRLSAALKNGKEYDFGDTLFKVQMQFETGDERYAWLNHTLAVAEARETGKKVIYRVYALA